MYSLNICFQDHDLLIVNKPSGLLTVPGLSTPDNLFDSIRQTFPNARTVHRLDMATSGLVIFALNHPAQKAMGKCFEHRTIHKTYIAEVYGQLDSAYGEINLPLICDWENRPKQKIDWEKGKKAITFYKKLSTQNNTTRVILTPHTGRSHQLRVHMLTIGHPIIGDPFYNINDSQSISSRLHLHASELSFTHPINNTPVHIVSKTPF